MDRYHRLSKILLTMNICFNFLLIFQIREFFSGNDKENRCLPNAKNNNCHIQYHMYQDYVIRLEPMLSFIEFV